MWKLLGLSALSWGSGQAAWTWYESVLGREVPFPSLADVGYLAAPPLAAAALLSLPFAAQSLAGRVRQVLDGLMIAASLLLISWVLVLNTLFQAGADNAVSQAISLAYPIGDIVVGTIVLFVLARARMGQRRPAGHPAAPARGRAGGHRGGRQRLRVPHRQRLLLLGGADRRRLVPRLPADPAGRPQARGRGGRRGARPPTSVDRMGLFLPYVAVVGALAVSTVAQLQQGTLDSFAAWCRSFIILALVGRQVLSLLENLLAGPPPGGPGGRAHHRAAGQRAALPGAGPAQLRGRHPGRPRRQGRVRQRVHDQGLRLQRGPPARPPAHPDPRPRAQSGWSRRLAERGPAALRRARAGAAAAPSRRPPTAPPS